MRCSKVFLLAMLMAVLACQQRDPQRAIIGHWQQVESASARPTELFIGPKFAWVVEAGKTIEQVLYRLRGRESDAEGLMQCVESRQAKESCSRVTISRDGTAMVVLPVGVSSWATEYRRVDDRIHPFEPDDDLNVDQRVFEKNEDGGGVTNLPGQPGRMISQGAVLVVDDTGQTVLHLAARSGMLNPVRDLLAAGANVNVESDRGFTPLYDASFKGQAEVVALLLQNGARADVASERGLTPLHGAATSSQVQVLELLLKHGAAVDAANDSGETPLHWAAGEGATEAVELLLTHGADPTRRDQRGRTPVDTARQGRHEDVARLLRVATRKGRSNGR
jgi:hypothetical protein